MRTTQRFIFPALALVLVLAVIGLSSCKKDSGTTQLRIRLTDNPIIASEVNVDIREVRVNMRDDSTGWVTLETVSGIYNLLGLQNGVDTLIAQGTVPTGTVKEIRFVLGDDNEIVIDNNTFPLTIPSGSESGLKIKVNKQLTSSLDSLIVDFDAALSIHQNGNGDYMLKPVLKIK